MAEPALETAELSKPDPRADPGFTSAGRRAVLRARLEEAGYSAILITSLPNLRYLTGFSGSAGVGVVALGGRDRLFTNFLYRDQVKGEIDPAIELVIATDSLLAAVRVELAGEERLAFESAHLSVAEREAWRDAGGPEMEGVPGWVEDLRVVKSPAETAAITRAAKVADRAFEDILTEIRPGITERELAARLDYRLAFHGSERPAFETIAAFGARSALPHARPGERKLGRGEIVLLDFGAIVDGYASDLSRTVACGAPDPRLVEIYAVVLDAQRAALAGLVPGLTGREADALAREPIEAAGYGERFGHSLGHGIGLEVHEDPRLARRSEAKLRTGTVVTVEPGIYIPDLGGVRIEDDAVVGPDGAQVLTAAPKGDLIIV
ncbi:MAG TPA: aminopeptidase P family protein [Gemmatimonadota bacterium]|nr:aminopeptidase P family protein [Gemmatimonadota bacterium]